MSQSSINRYMECYCRDCWDCNDGWQHTGKKKKKATIYMCLIYVVIYNIPSGLSISTVSSLGEIGACCNLCVSFFGRLIPAAADKPTKINKSYPFSWNQTTLSSPIYCLFVSSISLLWSLHLGSQKQTDTTLTEMYLTALVTTTRSI